MKMNAFLLGWAFAAGSALCAGAADPRTFLLGGGIRLEVEQISQGRFTMGSPEAEAGRNPDEKPHEVTLTRNFYLGRTAVTFAQWERFATETGYRSEAETGTSGGFGWNGSALEQRREFTWRNPGYPQTPEHPVVMITWEDAQQFLKWLSGKSGWTFTLPSEAQWEYACRAGSGTAWWLSADSSTAGAGLWSKENAGNQAHAVGSRPANPWNLSISGNVWEWCADWYGPYDLLTGATDPLQNVAPASDKPRRVLRGGSWLRPLKDARSAARYRNDARSRNADNGFRAMSFGPPETPPAAASSSPPQAPATVPPVPELEPREPRVTLPPQQSNPPPAGGMENRPPAARLSPPSSRTPWLPLMLIGGILFLLIRKIFRRSETTPLLPRSGLQPPPPPPLPGPLDLAPGTFLTRPVQDGFWLNAGFAAGTWLNLTWRDENGLLRERRVQYAPGGEGHFIYTGSTPEQIQISDGDFGGVSPMPIMPPFVSDPQPPLSDTLNNDRNPNRGFHSGTGHYRPSAY